LCGNACDIGFPDMGEFVGYVGMTTQLKSRMSGHEILKAIPDEFYVMRWFLRTDERELRSVESALIKKYNPPWNISGKARGLIK
jgi:excinuclease UvrABC nuclease subunit